MRRSTKQNSWQGNWGAAVQGRVCTDFDADKKIDVDGGEVLPREDQQGR